MAMSQGKIAAAVSGGVFAVACAALGYLLFDAYTRRTEAEEEREDELSAYRRLNAAAVFPSEKSIAAVNSNAVRYAAWTAAARAYVAQGDKAFAADETPASFKQRLAGEVRRLAGLPGGVEGHLAQPTFFFGFDKYLGESAVLPETADVPRLAVQLDAIARFADLFAKAGVSEVTEVKRLSEAAPAAEEEEEPADRRKRNAKRKPAAKDENAPTFQDYALTFTVRPESFGEVLNALTADRRFSVITAFAFKATGDMIVDRLNAAEALKAKKDDPGSGSRRRRRRAAFEAEEEKPEVKGDDRLVVDPELEQPVQVEMTVRVYDFGQAAKAAQAAAAEEAPAAAKKEGEARK